MAAEVLAHVVRIKQPPFILYLTCQVDFFNPIWGARLNQQKILMQCLWWINWPDPLKVINSNTVANLLWIKLEEDAHSGAASFVSCSANKRSAVSQMQMHKHVMPNVIVNTLYVHVKRPVRSLNYSCKHREMSSSETHCGKCLHLFHFWLFTELWIVRKLINLYFQRRMNKTRYSVLKSAAGPGSFLCLISERKLLKFRNKLKQTHNNKKRQHFLTRLFESIIFYKKLKQRYITGLMWIYITEWALIEIFNPWIINISDLVQTHLTKHLTDSAATPWFAHFVPLFVRGNNSDFRQK